VKTSLRATMGIVAPAPPLEFGDHGLETASGVEHIVDQQQRMLSGQSRHQIVQDVNPHRLVVVFDTGRGRRANRDVIGRNGEISSTSWTAIPIGVPPRHIAARSVA